MATGKIDWTGEKKVNLALQGGGSHGAFTWGVLDAILEDGRLEVERATAAGRGEGRMTGSLLLEPHQESYRLDTEISLWHIRLDPPDAVTELLERPPIDIDIDLETVLDQLRSNALELNDAVMSAMFEAVDREALLAAFGVESADFADAAGIPIWTTTPWTLPANQAVALNPTLEYAVVQCNGPHGRERMVIVLDEAWWSLASRKINFLIGNPALAEISAVKHRRFVAVPASGLMPGVWIADTVRRIAEFIYPEISP